VTVYSKPFVVTIPLTATAAFAKSRPAGDAIELKGSVDYQACDDKICYNPVSLPLSWKVELKPSVAGAPPAATR
jgi:hypothetical protein